MIIKHFCVFIVFLTTLGIGVPLHTFAETTTDTPPNQIINGLSLTLDEAIHRALSANRTIRNTALGLESQKLSIESALSEFELKIAPSASAGVTDGEKKIGTGISLGKKNQYGIKALIIPSINKNDVEKDFYGEVAFSLAIPLIRNFGKAINLDTLHRSQFSLRSAERSFYTTQVNIVVDTVSAVYNVIKQYKLVELYEQQVDRLKGHVESARIKEKVGMATAIDKYRAEIRLQDVEDNLTQSIKSLRDAKDRLKIILAIPLEKQLEVSAPTDVKIIEMETDEAVEIALENRSEIKQSEDEVKEAHRLSAIAKNNLRPDLDLTVDYNRFSGSEDFYDSIRLDEDRWSLNLVSQSDFKRTSEKISFKQSLFNINTAEINLDAKKDNIKREVRRQINSLKELEERINIRKIQIIQAESKLALAEIKFNYDIANNFDIIEAETELRQAHVNLLSINTDYIIGTYRLRSVLGTLIEQ